MSAYKVVFVGDSAVGKTSLIHNFLKLGPVTSSTLGATSRRLSIDVDDSTVILNLWDTAGQEDLRNLVPIYAKGSHAAVIVFDLTSPISYEHVKQWYEYIIETIGNVIIWIAANKNDLPAVVDRDEARYWASNHNVPLIFTSAKNGENVVDIFEGVARTLEKREREKNQIPCAGPSALEPLLVDSTVKTASQGCFC
jgi:small GTP-binding protein